jgi:ribosomal protein S12 methylthiotransferase accessory factor
MGNTLCEAIQAEGPGHKCHLQGTHRAAAVEATFERISGRMKEWGVSRLADITGLDRIGIPVAMAVRPNARSVSVSQGKGLNFIAAATSALVEAVELHHAEHVLRPLLHAVAGRMVEAGHAIAATEGLEDPNRRVPWVETQDLGSGASCWIPHDLVHTDLTGMQPSGGGVPISSNGLAGGNSLTEATIHAICEVIERDATFRWQTLGRNERTRTRLGLASITDPSCVELLERFYDADFEVGVWNTTAVTGIPSYHAAILDGQNDDGHPGVGDGCHLSPGVALCRALTEAAQTRLTYIAGTRDDLDPDSFRLDLRRDRRSRHEALFADSSVQDFDACEDFSGDSLASDLAVLLDRLFALGYRALGVDLGRPETGLAVIRVVVPGMRVPSEHK